MKELPKAYEAKRYEDGIYEKWEASGLFNPDVCAREKVIKKNAKPFSIALPPPNVTGTLHMGHAVMLAIQDAMVRYHRMRGDRTLWLPGTDHAAIATQSKVEGILYDKEKKTRHDLGREEFLKRVERFAQESHDTIVNQCKKMGASLDWSREAFTLDEQRNLAVRTVFKMMYDDGVIYRGDRIVNWDARMQSNVADDEVEWREEKTSFYHFQYGPFVIGTVRPETKFGDKYVVMHPDDARYKKYKDGQKIELEWINGPIAATVVKDKAVDPSFGTGVMTITPWHTAIDFEIAERHGLEKEQIIGYDGKLLPIAGEFASMDAAEARPRIVEKLKQKGLLVKVDENYVHNVAVNYRGGGVIEPQIRKQWFIDVNKKVKCQKPKAKSIFGEQDLSLKEMMQKAVRDGHIQIIPDRFEKQYFHWIDNLRDWCISRQIWYGHRIPVWYCTKEMNGSPHVSVEPLSSCPGCGAPVEQDPDTLDTWFSAGLWTFSTLGWPEKTADFKAYHPTSVLETGYDILFFWVARMILMTTYALGVIPFEKVYLHGLVRDEQGRKMSKSLGNIINPLDMIDKYGTDATRLSLLIGNTPGNDMKLSEAKVAGFRNFTNKLWNISRFMLLNINKPKSEVRSPKSKTLADRWILARLTGVTKQVTDHLEAYNFSMAGEILREFTWGDLADWYLEIAKIEKNKDVILNYLLNTVLKLWHPFMPFVTEAIWEEAYGGNREEGRRGKGLLMIEKWPVVKGVSARMPDAKGFDYIRSIVTGVRSLRADYGIDPAKKLSVVIGAGKKKRLTRENAAVITALARIETLTIETSARKADTAVGFVLQGIEVYVDFSGVIDSSKEKERLTKEIAVLESYMVSLEKKLANEQFVKHAPPGVVAKERQKLAEAKEKLEKLTQHLKRLS